MPIECKLVKLGLNLDMSGMVQPCNMATNDSICKKENGSNYNLLNDDIQEIWHSKSRQKIIEDHKNDIRTPLCKNCWEPEEAGIKSPRQIYNEKLADLEVLENQPRIMIVKPGNLCNNACRSCNAHTSSMWYKDDHKLNHQDKDFKTYLKFFHPHKFAYKDNKLLEQRLAEWEDGIVLWSMYGGEPMIIPLNFKILDQAVANKNAKNKEFDIHSNGMVYKDDLIKKLSKFKHSNFAISIDATGKKNDYIRYGSKWNNIISNLKKYIEDAKQYSNVCLEVRITLTPLNLYHYDETVAFFKSINVRAVGLWCDDKPWNDVRYLPTNIKQKVITKWRKTKDKDWVKEVDKFEKWLMTEPNNYNGLQNSFIEFNKKLDSVRNEKFNEVFPEYSKLFEEV